MIQQSNKKTKSASLNVCSKYLVEWNVYSCLHLILFWPFFLHLNRLHPCPDSDYEYIKSFMHNCLTSRVNIDVFSNFFSGNEKINWSNWLFLWEVLTCINYHQMHCMVYICICPSTRACFTHLETLSLTVKNYRFLYTLHWWSLSSVGSLTWTCHTYCDTGLLLIMVISNVP